MPQFNEDDVIQQVRLELDRNQPEHARVYAEWLRRYGSAEAHSVALGMLREAGWDV